MLNRNGKYATREVCEQFDISKATLFRWEREGLLTGVGRDWRNWRLYSEANIREIRKLISSRKGR